MTITTSQHAWRASRGPHARGSSSLALARCVGTRPQTAKPTLALRHRARRRGEVRRQPTVRPEALFNAGGGDTTMSSNERDGGPTPPPPPQRRSLQALVAFLLSIPKRLDRYYSPPSALLFAFRRTMWCGISAGAGFYAGNIVTLSFGALAINDVFAGVVTLLFYEVITRLFYGQGGLSKKSLGMWFVNYFKLGVVLSCLADAIKLGG